MSHPYRAGALAPRFVCLACLRSLSVYSGSCRTCGVPRLDFTKPEVREQVRTEAERRLQKQLYREYSILALTSSALVAPALWWFGSFALALVPAVTMVVGRVYSATRQHSAIATYAARRRRLSAELGLDVDVVSESEEVAPHEERPPSGKTSIAVRKRAVDPLDFEIESLLAWLGARLDD